MIAALIVVALCYIIPTALMLLFFKYTKIGKTASDDEIFYDSFMPILNILYAIFALAVLVGELLAQFSKLPAIGIFKRKVLKFVRGK